MPQLTKHKILSLLFVLATGYLLAQQNFEFYESDSLNYAFVPKTKSMYFPLPWVFGKRIKADTSFHIKSADFTKNDYTETNKILKQQLDTCHLHAEMNYAKFKKFVQQYGVYNTTKNTRVVYINCVCSKTMFGSDWKKEVIDVMDGGQCFYHIAVDLTNKKILAIWHNTSG